MPSCICGPTRARWGRGCSAQWATPKLVQAYDNLLLACADHWLAREVTLYLKRTLKRLDVSSRSLVALIETGGCFAGTLAGAGPGSRPLLYAGRSYGR